MTPSKYQRAIEAIRTKEDFRRVIDHEFGYTEKFYRLSYVGESLSVAVKTFKAMFPGWWYTIGDCNVSADASIGAEGEAQASFPFEVEHGSPFDSGFHHDGRYDTDFAPSPAKSLLIVMLMALEEIDKREAQS